jgi:hypothetical protein
MTSRRHVLASALTAVATLVGLPLVARASALRQRDPTPHPTPRPGITGANVLTAEQLREAPKLIPLFDTVRAMPEIVDGIRCNCGCTGMEGFYSLLSCYEGKGMARSCGICQGQAKLAGRLHREGKSLDEIRSAIDAKFG